MLPPQPQPVSELPPLTVEKQADPPPTWTHGEETPDSVAMESDVLLSETEIVLGERPAAVLESVTVLATSPVACKREGQLKRKIRRPTRYQDYECYTLQRVKEHLEDQKSHHRTSWHGTPRLKTKKVRKRGTIFCPQAVPVAPEYQQDVTSYCS